jgi:hypothetical protein
MRKQKTELPRNQTGKVDPRSLASLYPQAKTFAQRALDDNQREKRMMRRQPHFVRLKIALYTSVLTGAALFYFFSVQHLWTAGSVAGIFLSFGIALIIAFSIAGCLYYTYQMFYYFNRSFGVYLFAQLVLIAGLLFLFNMLQKANDAELLSAILYACGAHFVALYVFLLFAIRYSRSTI